MDIVKYTKDSTFQRLKSYYTDETSVELTDKELAKLERLTHIWGLRINNKYSAHQSIQILIRDHKVSRATAYRDYAWSQQLFGEIDGTNIAAERQILKESYWNLYQQEYKRGNFEAAKKALDSYKSLFNFNDTEQKVDPNKLQAHEYHLHMPRWVYKKMDAIMAEGSFDFNNLDVEDVEFKEDGTQSEDDGE
ncbi:hypothetical protein [Elizabethkingia anophelis]|uniref:hypothetical protein n=1 Tax=Elizabethkingia anophelis TaxID=1117645 RepID=UPI0029854F31|nr:hypothetical protein [Elizabethkingia anophelis]HAY3533737.1 hypothetical protein [Elizabethkingia anophelis]HAY3545853.1 hypothetical protein [Elizabethkingia anophelis]HAY3590679.1 hypothetical protein [Elizabethkingia anophelis]